MSVEYLTSTDDLRKLQKRQRRRVVKLKFEDCIVDVTFIGGWYRARLYGSAVVGFGATPTEASQRLRKLEAMRSLCAIKACDVTADRAERREESVAAKAAKRSVRYDPKGNR